MQSQKLLEILDNPYELTNEDVRFLEEFCYKYSYCQTLQILLAKCYQKIGSSLFEGQVNLASTYSINRQKFQSYISEKEKVNKKQNISDDQIAVNEYVRNITNKPTEDIKDIIAENDINHNQSSRKFDFDSSSEIELSENSLDDDLLMKKRKKQLEQIVLRRINAFKKKDVKKEAPVIASSSVIAKQDTEKKSSKQDEIIEKFIREKPRINSPKDSRCYNDIDLSSDSVEFNDNILSETLAEIYLKQGKIDRSLYIFEKLSLKFPKKSSYFAKKIEQIKNSSKVKTKTKKKTNTKKRT